MAKPFIRKTGFWADGINGLLLRPPHRTYKTPAVPGRQEGQSPSASNEEVDTDGLTAELREHVRSILKEDSRADAPAQTLVGSRASEAHTVPVKSASFRATIAGTNPPPGFPVQLWERSLNVPTMEEYIQTLDGLPEYITEALRDDTMFSEERLKRLGFDNDETTILRMIVIGIEAPLVSVGMGYTPEHIQEVLDKAYEMYGVSNPQGIHAAVCWLAAKEAEGIARNIRQKFEKDVLAADIVSEDVSGSSTGDRENRPTVSHGSESESEARNRRYME